MTARKLDRFGGSTCWLLMGILVCAVVFGPVGCEPQGRRTIRIQAVDLSQVMLTEQDQIAYADERDEDTYVEEEKEEGSLNYEAMTLLKEYQVEQPEKEDLGLTALKLFGSPIHGGAPQKILPYTPPAPKARSGGGKKKNRGRNNNRNNRNRNNRNRNNRNKGGGGGGGAGAFKPAAGGGRNVGTLH